MVEDLLSIPPIFFVRTTEGNYYLVETKGREDRDVPRKARAAVEWCKSASLNGVQWKYLYVSQGVFERLTDDTIAALARTCEPTLQSLLGEEEDKASMPLFATAIEEETKEKDPDAGGIVEQVILDTLPPRYRKASDQAIALFRFLENKTNMDYAPIFQALLGCIDEACKGLMLRRLQPLMPTDRQQQIAWFNPYVDNLGRGNSKRYIDVAKNLKKTLVFGNGFSPLGLLRNCVDIAMNDKNKIDGVFEAIKETFQIKGGWDLLTVLTNINDFRNTYVAHQEKELKDVELTKIKLSEWIAGLHFISSQP